ncbi:MAG: c-type cytochrome [Planctomycetota bacterium]|jgi:cytochrome c2
MARSTCTLTAAILLVGLLAAREARAEGDAEDFRKSCLSCHTIGGGPLTGPDLKDVTQRQTRDWLVRFMMNPKAVIDSGDPYAVKIFAASRNVYMAVPDMTERRAQALLDLIEAESLKPEGESRFAKSGVSDRPFTPDDVAIGRDLFIGSRPLQGGGPACISCHAAGETGALGGGRLGPDLTEVYARLDGRKTMGAWLLAPPTETMQPTFADHPLDPETEILPLMAFFKDAGDKHVMPNLASQRITFLLLSVAGAAVLLLLMDLAWKRRFRSVRAALVRGQS